MRINVLASAPEDMAPSRPRPLRPLRANPRPQGIRKKRCFQFLAFALAENARMSGNLGKGKRGRRKQNRKTQTPRVKYQKFLKPLFDII